MMQKIIDELDKRIATQAMIVSGVNGQERQGFIKSMEAYQQAKLIVENSYEPIPANHEIIYGLKGEDIVISCGNCDQTLNGNEKYCYECGCKIAPSNISKEFKKLIDEL